MSNLSLISSLLLKQTTGNNEFLFIGNNTPALKANNAAEKYVCQHKLLEYDTKLQFTWHTIILLEHSTFIQ